MGARDYLANILGAVLPSFAPVGPPAERAEPPIASKDAPGARWYWPTTGGAGDMGPPGTWQRNLNPTSDPSILVAFSAVYACVQRIASDMGKLPIRIVEINQRTREEIDLNEDPFETLMRQPNAYQTRVDFIQTLMCSTLLQGNGIAWMRRNGRNEPVELHPWDWRTVEPRIGEDGSIFYKLGPNKLAGFNNGFVAPARDVIHHRMPMASAYPLHGVTPIYAAAASGSLGLRVLQQSQQFFGNMARPSGVLSSEANIDETTAGDIRKRWRENYREGGIGDTAVLGFGLKWQSVTLSAIDAQLIEQLRFSVEDVCRVFMVPTFLVGDTSKVTYRNSEQLARAYLQNCLGYHVEALQERLNLSFDFGTRFKIMFDLDALLKTELDQRFGAYQKALQSGVLTINEARALEGYGPVDGGDEPMIQSQNIPLSIAVENAKNPPTPTPALPAPAAEDPPAEPAPADDAADKDFDVEDLDELDDEKDVDLDPAVITARVAELMGVLL